MVAGKLLVRARYPGTGRVRVLLVGRLTRRERSAARAATNTARSTERVRRETAAIFFTSGVLGRVLPSEASLRQTGQPFVIGDGGMFSKTTTLSWDSACGCASTTQRDSSPPLRQSARRRFANRDSGGSAADNRRLGVLSHSRWGRKRERERNSSVPRAPGARTPSTGPTRV